MNVQEIRRLYVKPLAITASSYERHSASVTTGGFSDTSSILEWFRERLNRITTKEVITKAELAYAMKYYEVWKNFACELRL